MNLHVCPPPGADDIEVNRLERDPDLDVRTTILMDVPNITRRAETLSPHPINWAAVAPSVRSDTNGSSVVTADAFEMVGEDVAANGWHLKRLRRSLRPIGFDVKVHKRENRMSDTRRRDIDQLVHEAMWKAVGGHVAAELGRAVARIPIQHRIVLFSGDGEYLDTVEALLETFNKDRPQNDPILEIELVVYSWEESLSGKFRRSPYCRRIVLLDNIKGIFG